MHVGAVSAQRVDRKIIEVVGLLREALDQMWDEALRGAASHAVMDLGEALAGGADRSP